MPAVVCWAIPAALALVLLTIVAARHPGRVEMVMHSAAAVWIGLTFIALPLLLARS